MKQLLNAFKHRYEIKRMIISFLVKSVIKMDANSVVSASFLTDLYDTFMNRTRALEALGEDEPRVYFVPPFLRSSYHLRY